MSKSRNDLDDAGYDADENDDRPSFMRVEAFLGCIEDRRRLARRTRWIALGVATAVAGVAILTAIGAMPVQAENVVLSATAVVAAVKLGN